VTPGRAGLSVETARLTGQPTSLAHLDCAAQLFGHPSVAAWIWPGDGGGPRTRAQVLAILEAQIAHWRREGFGWWWWREHESGRVVGEAGLQRTVVQAEPVVEVGWTLLPEHQGKGYASEAAAAALRVAFQRLGLDEVVALTMRDNERSLKVMARLGMRADGEVEHAGLPHALYRLRRDEAG
jgi:RimJ/RimL family protein N-acetyltransferase